MYPTISDALRDLFGIDIPLPFPTFGFFVALSFLIAAYLFAKELKRKEALGWLKARTIEVKIGEKASSSELIGNALIGFIIGYKLLEIFLNYSDMVSDPQGFILSTRGNFLGGLIGAVGFGYSKYREKEKTKLAQPKLIKQTLRPFELVGNMTMIAAISGILGAKIFHNLENLDELMADPVHALLSFSGLSIYGGLIIGGISVLYYAVKNGLTWIHVADACAPGLMAAYAMGRVGCQLSGDGDWGMPNTLPKPEWMSFLPDWMWAYDYVGNVLGRDLGYPGNPVTFVESGMTFVYEGNAWPTPFYETIMASIIFGILWALRKRIMIPGFIFSLYMTLNGVERFFIEKIRINPDYHFFGISATQAEIIAVLMFVSGLAGIYYFTKNKEKFIPKTT
ncbi:MAG: prolipoprotein diacylglyceryl transferase [Flavobacteriales bacterium]|nr:prolipoprotein diacylglyceryl transferase [Flavobacteriales bacterium]